MKRNVFSLPLIIVLGLLTASCQESALLSTDINNLHSSSSIDDFLWKKNKPDTLKAYINTDFAECEDLTSPLVLQLCDDDALAIDPSIAQLYVNGEISPDNTVSIVPASKTGKTEIWIVLDQSQISKDRTFTWNLQVVENPGLLRINETTPDSTPWVPDTTVYWQNNHIANSLEVAFWTILAILACALAAFVIFMRLSHPAFRVRRLTYSTDDFQKTIVLSGVSSVVFSTEKKSQSFINQLLVRKVVYVSNDFFTAGDVTVTPKDRIMTDSGRRNGGRISARNYTVSNLNVAKDETAEIINDDTNKTLNITIN